MISLPEGNLFTPYSKYPYFPLLFPFPSKQIGTKTQFLLLNRINFLSLCSLGVFSGLQQMGLGFRFLSLILVLLVLQSKMVYYLLLCTTRIYFTPRPLLTLFSPRNHSKSRNSWLFLQLYQFSQSHPHYLSRRKTTTTKPALPTTTTTTT